MSTATPLVTADELFYMPDEGFRCELIEGRLKKRSLVGAEQGAITARLCCRVANFVAEKNPGFVTAAGTGFQLAQDPDTVRAPDIAFVKAERIPKEDIPIAFWPGAPDLAVEVVSPGDTADEVDEKVLNWLEHGCAQVWVVSPKLRKISVYTSSTDVTILTEDDTLDGGNVVPGFQCRVAEVFAVSQRDSE